MSVHREQLHIEGLEELDVDEPVVMLNLMQFRDKSLDGAAVGMRTRGTAEELSDY